MGFSSYECKGCRHPALSSHATIPRNRWMIDCVVIMPTGEIVGGKYDGYMRIESASGETTDLYKNPEQTPALYHLECWKAAGEPSEYEEGSKWAVDQGWFFDERDHASAPPGKPGFFEYKGD